MFGICFLTGICWGIAGCLIGAIVASVMELAGSKLAIATWVTMTFSGFFAGFIAAAVGINPGYSTYDASGVIVGISRQGSFVKSYEGFLLSGSDVGGAEKTEFTIVDTNLLPALKQALSSKARVRITCQKWFLSPYYMGSNSEITAIATENP